jgi:2,4-dienoyl-CoA reductase-like NADH-dependent reductase (Old Yellow Enzyme family)
MPQSFPLLLSPLQIGAKTVRNRILITGHVPRLADNNKVGERYVAYHRARARGGAGLQITGAQGVHPTGPLGSHYSLTNMDDSVIPGYRRLADAVHAEGGTILAQLSHSAATLAISDAGRPLWAPSPVQSELARETPRELTAADIREVVESFGKAAGRVRAGGLDGAELLAAFGFLIGAFFSPLTNRRRDAYGGSLENRLRFAHEVIEATRESLGPSLILGIRVSGDEMAEGGLGLADMREIAVRLTATGRLDYVNVIAGTNYARLGRMVHWGPTPSPHGLFVPLAAGIKEAVKVPVFTAGRITDPAMAESILREGKADMIGMTRAHIADPEIGRKLAGNRPLSIRPCVGANVCISLSGAALRCFHNPEVGRETAWAPLAAAAEPRKVAVVGGGPAGLEAARVAAERGHRVTLYDAEPDLGGRLRLWASSPLTRELGKAVNWRLAELERLQVRIERGRPLTEADVARLDAEAIVLATGSRPMGEPAQLASPGPIAIATPEDILRNPPRGIRRAVLWDNSSGREGLAAAEVLASLGTHVAVVTNEFTVAESIDPVVRTVIYQHLLGHGAVFRPNERLLALEGQAVRLVNLYSGAESCIDGVELLVSWQGRLPRNDLAEAAGRSGARVIVAGDAVAPRSVTQAVAEGALAGRSI